MGVRPVEVICACTTHKIQNRQTAMLPAGFKPAIPASWFRIPTS